MNVQPAVQDDLDELVAVQEAAAVAGLSNIFPQDRYPFPRDIVLARWTAELADPETSVLVSTDDAGRITGFAALHRDELLHFGTAVSTWGTGLAVQFHDALLGSFPSSVQRCRLRVYAQNRRARRFYEKLGWAPTGEVTRSTFAPFAELVAYTRSVRDTCTPESR